jgi:isohexenylglutaconyl-CoA hydratase
MSAGATFRLENDLLEITLCRPPQRNALGEAELAVLAAAIEEAYHAPACELVVIRGDGDFFCAGVDLKLVEASSRQEGGLLGLIERNGAMLQSLERLPQLVIVALNGPAVGLGVHIALCGDLILAHKASYLWIPEAKLGIPDVLHYRLIEQRLGRSAAIEMLLLGRRIPADEASRRGLMGQCYDDGVALSAGVADHLDQLRAVPGPVRAAMKRHMSSSGPAADPAAQVAASASVLDRPQGREG